MTKYCGIDLGSESTCLCVVDGAGEMIAEEKIFTDEASILETMKRYSAMRCIVEAAPLAEWFCRVVERAGHMIDIIDTRQARVVTHSKKKTDRIDASKLAQLARTGWYTRVHRKSGKARELRSFMTARNQLVKTASAAAASIRGIFRAHGVKIAGGELFEKSVRVELRKASGMLKRAIPPLLKIWNNARKAEKAMYKAIPRITKDIPEVELLQSVPGVGPATAAVFVATIDDPRRFPSSEQVASYVGLVPRVHQSGETEYRGRITKEGDRLLRWLLVESAGVLLSRVQAPHPLKEWGLALERAKGIGKARVAVARKLACLLHCIWRSGKPYSFQVPEPAALKIAA